MNIPNLTDLMISVTDFKKQIADIMKNKKTKVIVRNNEPVSIIMPYADYQDMTGAIKSTGEPFVLPNGVVMKVLVEVDNEQIAIKQYIQMKSTGEWKLHFTNYMGHPRPEEAMTTDEIMASYQLKRERLSVVDSIDEERATKARTSKKPKYHKDMKFTDVDMKSGNSTNDLPAVEDTLDEERVYCTDGVDLAQLDEIIKKKEF